jgi:hypothetical protein
MDSAMTLALQIARNPPDMVQGLKQIMAAGVGEPWGAMLGIEQEAVHTRLTPGPARESFADFLDRKGT